MSAFDLSRSLAAAQRRLARSPRKARADRGHSRLDARLEKELERLLAGQQRPSMSGVHTTLKTFAEAHNSHPPSRATLYNALTRVSLPALDFNALPTAVQRALYNLTTTGQTGDLQVPGDQVVFYSFNYGAPRAISYASGLPWLCLWRAERRQGWRPKSRSLLQAVMKYRRI